MKVRTNGVNCAARLVAIIAVVGLLVSMAPVSGAWTAFASGAKTRARESTGVHSVTATKTEDGVLLTWRSADRDDNLGFNVYRVSGARRIKLNRAVVPGVVFDSGRPAELPRRSSYAFLDRGGRSESVYLIENVTVEGAVSGVSDLIQTTPGIGAIDDDRKAPENLTSTDDVTSQQEYPGANRDSFAANGPIEDQWSLAEQPALKILIKRDDWYRVTHQQATTAGFNPTVDVKNLQLFVDGREVGIRTSKASGVFGSGDYFEFFGRGIDTPTTDTRVHYLIAGVQPGKRILGDMRISDGPPRSIATPRLPVLRMPELSSQYWFPLVFRFVYGTEDRPERIKPETAPPPPAVVEPEPSPEKVQVKPKRKKTRKVKKGSRREWAHASVLAPQSFAYTVERKDRLLFFFNALNGEEENYFGNVVTTTPLNQTLITPNPEIAADGPARLEVALQGVGAVPHQVNVSFNGVLLGTMTYFGITRAIQSFDIPMSLINNGNNTVRLASAISTVSLVDYTRITYPHALRADNNSLRMSLRYNQSLTITDFTTPNVRLLDRTDPYNVRLTKPEVQQTGGTYSAKVPGSVGKGKARLLDLFPAAHFETPAGFMLNQPSTLNRPNNGADLLIIAHKSLIGSLSPLVNLRQSQGLVVSVVDIDDVYDEFGFGKHGPQAIKDFLARASSVWSRSPRYVLLVGDASHDPRNYEGKGDLDFIPTKLIDATFNETSSDDWLSDLNNDGLPEIPVGRLPVRTTAQADLIISKIVRFSPLIVPQSALLVADDPTGYYFNFETANDEVQSLLPASMNVERVDRRTDSNPRANLINKFNSGKALVNYAGHGNVDTWTSASIFTNADAARLTNAVSMAISQVYGGGGETGSTYRNDFVELFNRGAWPVNLSGWSLQYSTANGTSWQVLNLPNVVVAPGKYFLVQLAQGAGGTTNLPAPDATGTINVDLASGKVVLVSSTTPLSGSGCPFGLGVVDFVGYGTADCANGTAAATLSATTAVLRAGNGCTNTNSNSADFFANAPLPRTSAVEANTCINASTRLPFSFVVVMDCLNGLFQDPSLPGLAEVLMSAPNGGSVAAFASSGLTIPDGQHAMARQLYILIYGSESIALGDAVRIAKGATTDIDVRRTWILFGDPSMKIR